MRKVLLSTLFGLSLFAATVARADSMTYSFTYSGTGNYVAGETATGTGFFAYTYTPGGGKGTLTAFSFTDTLTSSEGNSTFSYSGLADVSSSGITLKSDGTTATISIATIYVTGSNAAFGPV